MLFKPGIVGPKKVGVKQLDTASGEPCVIRQKVKTRDANYRGLKAPQVVFQTGNGTTAVAIPRPDAAVEAPKDNLLPLPAPAS